MSSSFGNILKTTIFGESHGPAIGVTIEGLPVGEVINYEELQRFLDRRTGGKKHTTARKESDIPQIISGVKDNKTTGTPLTAIINNDDVISSAYGEKLTTLRPSHVDYPAYARFGDMYDSRGSGHYSGRLTAALCIAGGISLQIMARRSIHICARITEIAGIQDDTITHDNETISILNALKTRGIAVIDEHKCQEMIAAINRAKSDGDSVGGIIECHVLGLPVGVGEPIFDGVENHISRAIFSIGAVRGIEFGAGFLAARMRGSEHNDMYRMHKSTVNITTNNAGGVLGGLTTGSPLIFRVAFKPTPTIGRQQKTVDISTKSDVELRAGGRHDPCIVPRAVPCVEAAAALAILDLLLMKGEI